MDGDLQAMLSDKGYRPLGHMGPFTELVGGLYRRDGPDGEVLAFLPQDQHLNGAGIVHGGALMTFMDMVLGRHVVGHVGLERLPVTLSLNCNFVSAGRAGDLMEGRPRIVQQTRSVVFVEGDIVCRQRVVMSATGIWKMIKPPAAG